MLRSTRFMWWSLATLLAVLVLVGCHGKTTTAKPKSIDLIANQGPTPRKQQLSRGLEEPVQWHNGDAAEHTVRFTDWPFREPQQDIVVPAGQNSAVFHVRKAQDPGTYSYGVFPPLPGDPGLPGAPTPPTGTGPPDPPAVVVGD